MRHTLFAGAALALLLSNHIYAADTSAPSDTPPAHRCHAERHDTSAPAGEHCAKHGPHGADEHDRFMPPPHEPPLAAVKACIGKKVGHKTTIFFNGDSIPAVCQHYDGMVLAQPLQPRHPDSEAIPH
ncbi:MULTISPECIES: hypothetical protein [Aquitalea]|uniref:hypothetical protein n=1 Tax=Aquitalea TaxID=407217 RepID=UPI00135C4A29|nr:MULTISPECIES: hypothetical protein [Aquitalea]